MLDSFGRKINYLRISITDLCNLRCRYCMPEKGICKVDHEDVLTLEEIEEIAKVFVSLGINKIRLTGGEPLVKNGIIGLIERISSLEGVKDLAITTNGLLLKKYAKDLKNAGLSRVNISLDTLNEKKYAHITRGGSLKSVIEGLEEARKVGLKPIKINAVLIGGFNDDEIEDFVKLTIEDDIDVRFIELMPIGEASGWAVDNFISNEEVLRRVKGLVPTERIDPSSPATYYKLPGAKGRVGIINPVSCKFCSSCNRIRMTSQGKIKLCLHSDDEIDLKEALRSNKPLEDIILASVLNKPKEHKLEEGQYISKNMVQIGG